MTPNNFRVKNGLTVSNGIVVEAGVISGNGSSITSVNAATLNGNTAAQLRAYTDSSIGTSNTAIVANASAAYTNAVSYTDTKIGTANSAITGNAATAYTNAVSYTDTKIGTANTAMAANAAAAYTNAVSYTDGKILTANSAITGNAATAYTNATTYASNASNLSTGTVAEARLPYRMNQNVRTTDSVEFADITLTGNLVVSGTRTYVNTTTLDVGDNIITLNADLGAAAPTQDAGIEIMRGTSANVQFIWDETNDRWSTNGQSLAANTLIVGGTTLNSTWFGATANNADLLDNQHGSYYTNATNITTGTLPYAQIPANVVNTTANFTITGQHTYNVATWGVILRASNTTNFSGVRWEDTGGTVRAGWYRYDTSDLTLSTYYANGTYQASPIIVSAATGGVTLTSLATTTGTFGGAVSGITTLAAGNTTITGFANVSTVVNSASFTVGSTVIANTTGTYATFLNAKTEGNLNVNAAAQLTTTRAIGDVNFNGTANIVPERIYYKDTRASNYNPFTHIGATLHLKTNTTDSLSDGGTYHGVLDLAHWSDSSGGVNHQLGLTDNNNLYIRASSNSTAWTSWSKFYQEGTVLPAGNTTITGFANVTSTLQVGGVTTLSANASAVGSISVTTTSTTMAGILVSNSSVGMYMVPNAGAGAYNNLVSAGDNLLYFSNNTQNNGNLVIGSWSSRAGGYGIKFTSNTYDVKVVANTLTVTANVAMGNNYIVAPVFQAYSEYVSTNATATGAITLDLSTSNFFNLTLTGNITPTFSNPPSGRMFSFTFVAKQDATGGRTITWPAGTKWPGGVAPPATTTANAIDIWSVMTYDGGSTWIASLSVKNAS